MNDARARVSRDASCCGIINRHTHVRPLDGAHRSREILQRAPTLASVGTLCRAVCFRVNTGPADGGDLDSSSRGASVISEHAEDGRLLHELFETASQAWPLRHARKVVAVSPSLFDILRAMGVTRLGVLTQWHAGLCASTSAIADAGRNKLLRQSRAGAPCRVRCTAAGPPLRPGHRWPHPSI